SHEAQHAPGLHRLPHDEAPRVSDLQSVRAGDRRRARRLPEVRSGEASVAALAALVCGLRSRPEGHREALRAPPTSSEQPTREELMSTEKPIAELIEEKPWSPSYPGEKPPVELTENQRTSLESEKASLVASLLGGYAPPVKPEPMVEVKAEPVIEIITGPDK